MTAAIARALTDTQLAQQLATLQREVERRRAARSAAVERAHEEVDYARNHSDELSLLSARQEVSAAVRAEAALEEALKAAQVRGWED